MSKAVCFSCGVETEDFYWADNNASGNVGQYCPKCEERRSEKYGCAMMLSEGATCENGICGCGGTGVY
jgi:hypothetical protein